MTDHGKWHDHGYFGDGCKVPLVKLLAEDDGRDLAIFKQYLVGFVEMRYDVTCRHCGVKAIVDDLGVWCGCDGADYHDARNRSGVA